MIAKICPQRPSDMPDQGGIAGSQVIQRTLKQGHDVLDTNADDAALFDRVHESKRAVVPAAVSSDLSTINPRLSIGAIKLREMLGIMSRIGRRTLPKQTRLTARRISFHQVTASAIIILQFLPGAQRDECRLPKRIEAAFMDARRYPKSWPRYINFQKAEDVRR